ncbi:helix-turn-helix transcriptional regulator [Halocatena pleomorpha]|uniref:ArsR family transcriptional regulator n=1 Tax=Halocatena pleomorpha TaxID=1785090 RepID=A0A3P3RHA7_9EURY|nr:ArsR family transcriptional regulator [Halocatena pleomorpha]RRJ31843.1 ArsR family transcriptional regulator [Halocatena pleomorpha]
MNGVLEEVEFLARSEHRVAVLRLLADESHTRGNLVDATGASQATLSRILRDFEDRSWIQRGDGTYSATATGCLIAYGFTDLLNVLTTERELRDVVEHLPTEELRFDLRHLTDATVTLPTGTRPDAPVGRLLELERNADRVRAFSHAFNERSLSLVTQRVHDEELVFEGVFSCDAIDALATDPGLRDRLVNLLDADGATVRVHEQTVPLAVTVAGRTVHLLVRDANGVLRASIDTDDSAVRSWAIDAFDGYWDRGRDLNRIDLFE